MQPSCAVATCVLVLTACGHQARAPSQTCRAQTIEFKAWLETLAKEGLGDVVLPRRGIDLATVDAQVPTSRLEHAPVVTITPDVISYDGEPVAESSKVPASAPTVPSLATRITTKTLLVEVDRASPWTLTRAVLRTALAQGADRVVFVVERAPLQPRPAPSSLDDQIQRAMHGFPHGSPDPALVEKVYGNCPEARTALQKASGDPAMQDEVLLVDLPNAIERCNCSLDFGSARAFHWAIAGRLEGPVLVGVPLTLATDGTVLDVPDGARWSEALAALSKLPTTGAILQP